MKIILFIGALVLTTLDQLSKVWVREYLPFSENTGIAFSLPLPVSLTIPIAIGVIAFLLWQLWTQPPRTLTAFALMLIVAGAAGNLIDRVLFGAVTDFISVYSFPVFNLADSFISMGVVLYLWNEVFGK